MAITSVDPFYYPTMMNFGSASSNLALGSVLLNASTDKVAFVFQVPKTGTLDKAEFLWSAVANNPDNGMKVSFQDLDATTGFPDTTADQFRVVTGAPITAGWAVPGLITSDGTDGGVKRSVTKGDMLSFVIEFSSFVASDSISPAVWTGASNHESLNCYVADASTGTYTKSATGVPLMVLKYDDGTYVAPYTGFTTFPVTALTLTSYNSGSTPDEYAVRFQMPFSCRVAGLWARVDPNDDLELVLYNGTTAEKTISIDKDNVRATTPGYVFGLFATQYTISANTTYRVAVKPTTTTNIQITRFTGTSASVLAAIPGGAEWYESTRTDAGAWSDTTTSQPMAGLIIDGIDIGSGGTGGGSFAFVG